MTGKNDMVSILYGIMPYALSYSAELACETNYKEIDGNFRKEQKQYLVIMGWILARLVLKCRYLSYIAECRYSQHWTE